MGRRCSARGQRQRLTAGPAQAAAWVQRGRRSACASLAAKGQHAARRCTRHRPTPAARPASFARGAGGSSHPRERRPHLAEPRPAAGLGASCSVALEGHHAQWRVWPPAPRCAHGVLLLRPRAAGQPERRLAAASTPSDTTEAGRCTHGSAAPPGPWGHRPLVRVLSCAYTRLPSSCAAHCRQLRPHLASAAARSPTSLGGDRQADPDTATPERPRRRVTLL